MPKLKLISERFRGEVFDLNQDRHSCGRSKDAAITIPDSTISSHHCDFVRAGSRYVLRDAGSTNGSRINNIPVTEQPLYHSDIIQLGGVEILYEDEADDARFVTRTQHGIVIGNDATKTVTMSGFTRPAPRATGKNNLLVLAIFITLALIIIILLAYVWNALGGR